MVDRNKWVAVSTRLPNPEEQSAFGGCECILQCRGSHNAQSLRFAKPVFIGGNPDKVIWFDAMGKSGECIENSAWEVTHWRPFPKFPKPLPAKEDQHG